MHKSGLPAQDSKANGSVSFLQLLHTFQGTAAHRQNNVFGLIRCESHACNKIKNVDSTNLNRQNVLPIKCKQYISNDISIFSEPPYSEHEDHERNTNHHCHSCENINSLIIDTCTQIYRRHVPEDISFKGNNHFIPTLCEAYTYSNIKNMEDKVLSRHHCRKPEKHITNSTETYPSSLHSVNDKRTRETINLTPFHHFYQESINVFSEPPDPESENHQWNPNHHCHSCENINSLIIDTCTQIYRRHFPEDTSFSTSPTFTGSTVKAETSGVLLFPYGSSAGGQEFVRRSVDFTSPLFKPQIGFPLGSLLWNSLYRLFIWDSVAMVAPFWDDADFSSSRGTRFYQEYETLYDDYNTLVQKVESSINMLTKTRNYKARWTLKITWVHVPAYPAQVTIGCRVSSLESARSQQDYERGPDPGSEDTDQEIFSSSGVLMTHYSSTISASFDGAVAVAVSVLAISHILHTSCSLSKGYQSHTEGLTGFWNGNPDDGFRMPNGSTILKRSSEEMLFHYGMTYRYPPSIKGPDVIKAYMGQTTVVNYTSNAKDITFTFRENCTEFKLFALEKPFLCQNKPCPEEYWYNNGLCSASHTVGCQPVCTCPSAFTDARCFPAGNNFTPTIHQELPLRIIQLSLTEDENASQADVNVSVAYRLKNLELWAFLWNRQVDETKPSTAPASGSSLHHWNIISEFQYRPEGPVIDFLNNQPLDAMVKVFLPPAPQMRGKRSGGPRNNVAFHSISRKDVYSVMAYTPSPLRIRSMEG
ncbi:hypothetical protein MJG53_000998 [Ovis ammon polii x Ovis aries]|uniref:Uncharacterized protein n=1 Tax=Ovis ammon polii x Ovis aries TaxID=2918886 RepID=A0ACB9VJP2_9CETA|nr:hypothetical protein MJT46_000491 [Ovis ammon polii x Ovis aries]KAI4589949.1 hypothetical protein MJG53_000998 [Ovis ammon polii x Ovis aries]